MFCQNCGKQIGKKDNFCRYCGAKLKEQEAEKDNNNVETDDENQLESYLEQAVDEISEEKRVSKEEAEDFQYNGEELVMYEVKKHWMALFWPAFLTPLFIVYFWTIFLNTHSFFSWIIVIGMLALIIYPIACYKADNFVITTKAARIKLGVIHPVDIEIPLEKLKNTEVRQSSMGRMLDYGTFSFNANSEKNEYLYVEAPEDLQYILDNPQRALRDFLSED